MNVRLRSATITAVVLSVVAAGPVVASGATSVHTATSSDNRGTASIDTSSAIVELTGTPLATLNAGQRKKLDFKSPKVKSARAQLVSIRNDFKQWLRSNAPKARVTSEYDVALNAVSVDLNGTTLDTLRSAPGVVAATLEINYEMLDAAVDPDLALINAVAAWGEGGAASAGAGIKVAVIDSGIDQTHPCFDGTGYPAYSGSKGDISLTNDKVIVAKVFNMRSKVRGFSAAPGTGQEHGTHVAGTIACEALTPAVVDGVTIPYAVSGVAPAAQLGNYNVFPGDVTNARSEDILNALQAAYEDGMDLANMSLGGGANGVQDLLTHAVDNLDRGGMLVAISAGNEGPGYFTVGSPGSAERALTSGAYSVGHFVGVPVTWTDHSILAAQGEFAVPTADLQAPLVAVPGSPLGKACSALTSGSLTGAIALISRGSCTFGTKVANAEAAGAVAVLMVNNVFGSPTAMAQDGVNHPTIPAVMAGLSDRPDLLAAALAAEQVTIGATRSYAHVAANQGIMEGFSSQGPTDVDFRVKPDVVAPGGNVLSSIPGNRWAFYSGTSMSSPHLAGMAAVVMGQHPSWTAAQVRSAIVNTANASGLRTSTGGTASDPLIIGNGAADLFAAVDAKVALDPVSTSFGAVPVLNGHTATKTITFAWLNGSGTPIVAVNGSAAFSASYSDGVITVTYTPRATGYGPQTAVLTVSDGSSVLATSQLFAWGK